MNISTIQSTASGKVALGFVLTMLAATAAAEDFFTIKDGQLQRPTGYREWVYVGTPLTPNDLNSGKAAFPEFHNVYIDPLSWAHWKTTGQFREGTIIMKELVSVGSKVGLAAMVTFRVILWASKRPSRANSFSPMNRTAGKPSGSTGASLISVRSRAAI